MYRNRFAHSKNAVTSGPLKRVESLSTQMSQHRQGWQNSTLDGKQGEQRDKENKTHCIET